MTGASNSEFERLGTVFELTGPLQYCYSCGRNLDDEIEEKQSE